MQVIPVPFKFRILNSDQEIRTCLLYNISNTLQIRAVSSPISVAKKKAHKTTKPHL